MKNTIKNKETLGLNEKIKVPTESIMWNPTTHQWNNVPKDTDGNKKYLNAKNTGDFYLEMTMQKDFK